MAKMQEEARLKKELMAEEFSYQMQLKGADIDEIRKREKDKEDRKDERTKIQATQQSKLIEQRQGEGKSMSFESTNDSLDSFDFGSFDPK